MIRSRFASPCVLLLVTACSPAGATTGSFGSASGGPDGDEPEATGMSASDAGTSGVTGPVSTGPGGDTEAASSEASSSTGGVLFDVGSRETEGEEVDDGCKIDFLFLIDNSPSMSSHQVKLIESFAGFASAVEGAVGNRDFHVLVTDTDPLWNSCRAEGCDPSCEFGGVHPCLGTPTECEDQPGAGITFPTGRMNDEGLPANVDCELAGGRRFITVETPDLAGDFACIAGVGESGSTTELPYDEMVGAVELTSPGGCNDGFIRDSAILVVAMVTDEPDRGSTATWQDVRLTFLQAKGGDEQGVVMFGLLPHVDPTLPNHNPEYAAEHKQLVQSLPNHRLVDISSPNYAEPLMQLLAEIETSCANYVPEG